ncbi:MAG: TVP38/TMEM64 family protein [Clostridia bacterium]|nr:TVP38/TMEM64 family protein [Clostridia bacterium]
MKNDLNKGKYLKVFFRYFPFVVIIIIAILLSSFKENLTVEQLLNYVPQNIPLAILFLLIMYALKSLSFVFPISLLMIVSGNIFNIPTAIIVNTIGVAICISTPYWIGRYYDSEFADNLINKYKKLSVLSSIQKNNDFFFSYIARVIGILPSDVVSLYMGSVGISYTRYVLGGVLGFSSRIIAITFIGSTITDPTSPAFIISFLCNIFIAIISAFIYKKLINKSSAQKDSSLN